MRPAMTHDRIWCPWPDRLFAIDTGTVRSVYVSGMWLCWTPQAAFLAVRDWSVTIFDGRAEYLPFRRDAPDAPGFWIGGRFYVAFNRGKQ